MSFVKNRRKRLPRTRYARHLAKAAKPFEAIFIKCLVSASLLRMTLGSRCMFVGVFAMFGRRGRVFFRLFVLPNIMMIGRLVMMMRGGVMVSGRRMVVLTRRMLRCLCHLR